MITVKLLYQENILAGIETTGHSGYSQHGTDIICAAVSVLMQSLILGLEDIAHVQNLSIECNERVPIISVTWPVSERNVISLLTDTTAASLQQIALDNPKHVKVITEDK